MFGREDFEFDMETEENEIPGVQPENPAQSRAEKAFACIRARSLYHDNFCHLQTSRIMENRKWRMENVTALAPAALSNPRKVRTFVLHYPFSIINLIAFSKHLLASLVFTATR